MQPHVSLEEEAEEPDADTQGRSSVKRKQREI